MKSETGDTLPLPTPKWLNITHKNHDADPHPQPLSRQERGVVTGDFMRNKRSYYVGI